MKTQKAFKLKTGETLPKGLPVTFQKNNPGICLVQGDRPEPYKIRVQSAFNTPSMEKLEEWSMDSVVESVAGNNVEPDGWDSEGTPSWLLVLGII